MENLNLPDWYNPQNFSDAGLNRTILDVGEFSIEFEYDPGDRSVGIWPGWEGVSICHDNGIFRTLFYFGYEYGEGMNFPAWPLVELQIGSDAGTFHLEDQHKSLRDFPKLLKLVTDKWEDIQEQERKQDEAMEAMFKAEEEEARAEHIATNGEHHGYDSPACPICR